ncbi:retrovirus-related pol polyprotein from transposon TNT 1-94 [Tanacetum coccineum]|uniref:Retrovirus-related pol polyprotein from transposon TNT 1-94 n=1 Tax=Tanacetum coccineum TaxID=301880 RepID=A0ABQ4X1S2_9ASTR
MRVQGVADSDISKPARGKKKINPSAFAFLFQERCPMSSFQEKERQRLKGLSSSSPLLVSIDEDSTPCSAPNIPFDHDIPNTPSEHAVLNTPSDHDIPNTNSDDSNASIPHDMPSTRRSTRATTQPVWLKDFVTHKHRVGSVVSNTAKNPVSPLFQQADFQNYPNEYVASLAHVLTTSEPTSYSQAANDPKWIEAMEKELPTLETNDTWTLTELPEGHKAISSKWVFKIKYLPNGTMDRYKARLVIRGFDRKEGVDYKHKFSPVAKAATVRVLISIAIATAKGWPLHQLDINNTFLHGFVDEKIYMKPPEGYTKASQGQVCKLLIKYNA